MTLADFAARALPRWPWQRQELSAASQDHADITPRHAHTTWESEPFIPVSRFEIAERMATTGRWGEASPDAIRRLFRYLSAWRHVIYKERLDDLEQTYLPFSPETDLLRIGTFTPEMIADHRGRFIGGIRKLLTQANYIQVPREEVPALMDRETVHGLALKVDLEDFEECLVYRRGTDYTIERRPTIWTGYLWTQEFTVPVYQRLAVLLKLWPEEARIAQVMAAKGVSRGKARAMVRRSRSSLPAGINCDRIYVKLFRDIPHTNLEMLFPNTRVQFSRIDKIRLGGSAIGGLGIGIFGAASSIITAAVLSPYLLGAALFGLVGIIVRQVMGFFNQRTQYMKILAENLYFHTLADNRSAFTLLSNRAEEEDVKEEMLLYSVLATEPVHRSELPAIRDRVSAYLLQEFNVDVAFDIYDALDRLMRDKVVREAPDGLLLTLSPHAALEHFDALWDGYLQPNGLDRRLLSEDAAGAVS